MPFGPCNPPLSLFLCSSLLFIYVSSGSVNVYIDDQTGDSATGVLPTYAPLSAWNQGAGCLSCAADPNTSQAHGGTWHDATYNPGKDFQPFGFTLQFNGKFLLLISSHLMVNHQYNCTVGTAISIFNIVQYNVFSSLNFSVDGNDAGSFVWNNSEGN